MKLPAEPSGGLDRGGKPTIRDLLSSLIFNPVNGTIHVNGDRFIVQRAAVSAELRRELTRLLGPEDARVFLIRLGFQSGRSDARFVRTNWPNLETGDAFTAGTRLHTFSGVVRVEAVYNDFDLRKKRFAAEFLWHDSVEAAEFRRAGRTAEPVCWTQLGYASGYASEFFDTLVVYKEVECAAQGHSHCRVVGKPADVWGASDPDVILFRESIMAFPGTGLSEPARKAAIRISENSLSELDRSILAPVRADLERLAPMALPVLVTGAPGTGRRRAARYLHRASGTSETLLRQVNGAQVDLQLCADIARHGKGGRRSPVAETILIDGAETIPAAMQHPLARAIEESILIGGARIIALVEGDAAVDPANLSRELWYALSGLVVRMPPLAEREGQRTGIARAMLPMLAMRMSRSLPQLDKMAAKVIEQETWPGNLPQLQRVLAAALAAHGDGRALTGRQIAAQLRRFPAIPSLAGGVVGKELNQLVDQTLGSGTFSLPEFEQSVYQTAMDRAGGNLSAAARLLGLSRAQLAYRVAPKKMKE